MGLGGESGLRGDLVVGLETVCVASSQERGAQVGTAGEACYGQCVNPLDLVIEPGLLPAVRPWGERVSPTLSSEGAPAPGTLVPP